MLGAARKLRAVDLVSVIRVDVSKNLAYGIGDRGEIGAVASDDSKSLRRLERNTRGPVRRDSRSVVAVAWAAEVL